MVVPGERLEVGNPVPSAPVIVGRTASEGVRSAALRHASENCESPDAGGNAKGDVREDAAQAHEVVRRAS